MKGKPGIAAGVLLGTVLVIGLWVGPGAMGRATPALRAGPNPVHRGEAITITGSGFQGHPLVLLRFSDGQPEVTVKPSAGRFTWSEIVPASTPDLWTISAVDARTQTALAVAVPW